MLDSPVLAHHHALCALCVPLDHCGFVPYAAEDVEGPALSMREPAIRDPVLDADAWLDVVPHPADGGIADPDVVRDAPCSREDVEVAVCAYPVDGRSHHRAHDLSYYADLDNLILVRPNH